MDDPQKVIFNIGFNPDVVANNSQIVIDAINEMKKLKNLCFGKIVYFNGPASLPVAMALSHEVCHICKAVGCFDPKLNSFVICVSHDPLMEIGDLVQPL